jgi:hypothetical protein
MELNSKTKLLQKIIDKSDMVKVESSSDPDFKTWKNLVERALIKIFGQDSTEYKHFIVLKFYYPAMIHTSTSDYTADHIRCFKRDFKMLMDSVKEYLAEFEEENINTPARIEKESISGVSKIFISHASKDSDIVEEIIEMLESIGIESNQIFCTSFEGYGIGLGENFLDAIKSELAADSLVLFVLSNNFYSSPVCMCEMGATWVLSKEHIPIIVPPLSYADIKVVIPLTQGFVLTDPLKLNSFKEKIETSFNLTNPLSFSTWERKRDRICNRLASLVES